jgi:hypothetical protein
MSETTKSKKRIGIFVITYNAFWLPVHPGLPAEELSNGSWAADNRGKRGLEIGKRKGAT